MSFHFLCPMSVNNCGSFPVTLLFLLPPLLLLPPPVAAAVVHCYELFMQQAQSTHMRHRRHKATRQEGNKAAAGTFCGPATGTCALRVAASISSWPVCGTLNVSIPHTVSSLHSAAGLWIAQSCMISRQSFGNAKNNKKKKPRTARALCLSQIVVVVCTSCWMFGQMILVVYPIYLIKVVLISCCSLPRELSCACHLTFNW